LKNEIQLENVTFHKTNNWKRGGICIKTFANVAEFEQQIYTLELVWRLESLPAYNGHLVLSGISLMTCGIWHLVNISFHFAGLEW